ncbi:MAG: TetR/AcrR family transcriptional regulator [Ghiorsea sp.]
MQQTEKRKRDPKGTKQAILKAAYEEMRLHGFQGASLSKILARTGVTKGALFHHYSNKLDLGYHVLDLVVEPMIVHVWMQPLQRATNPIDSLQDILRTSVQRMSNHADGGGSKALLLGCPLHQFAQEMSPLDVGFKERVNRVYYRWQTEISAALLQGQRDQQVQLALDVENTAMFIVSSISGALAMGKRTQSLPQCLEVLHGCSEHLAQYLEHIRA